MSNNKKINYVELPANDFEKVEAFYSAAFNWNFESYGPEYLAFFDGKMNGGFRHEDKTSVIENGATLVVLFADDLERTRLDVMAAGGSIHQEIFSFPGGRRFHFKDPCGNELAVWSDK